MMHLKGKKIVHNTMDLKETNLVNKPNDRPHHSSENSNYSIHQ